MTGNNPRQSQIGLDRIVRLAWLEKTARLALAGNNAQDTRTILKQDLQATFPTSNSDVRGSLGKTVTVLARIWLSVPSELESLRLRGLDLFTQLPQQEHMALHWGMLLAVYPFWGAVALQVGRLLRLQGTVAAAQVQRRVREQYGERETVSRRARYVLRSFVDWQVLKETDTKGVYAAAPVASIDEPRLTAWLVEAMLHTRPSGSAPLNELLDNLSLFPFVLMQMRNEELTLRSPALDVTRHSLDQVLVTLRPIDQTQALAEPSASKRR